MQASHAACKADRAKGKASNNYPPMRGTKLTPLKDFGG